MTETRLAAPAPPPGQTRAQERQQARRAQRLARYEAVLALHQQGYSQVAISEQVGLGRKTVRRYLRSDAFPERPRQHPDRPSLAPYDQYLRTRWADGCHNAHQLWQEIRSQGFPGQAAIVRQYLARWRPQPGRPGPPPRQAAAATALRRRPAPQPTRVLSPRQARWLLLRAWDA